jgi:membrane-bound ClpP family serine protease
MRQPLMWMAAALMLSGAVMLVADVGAAGFWIAVITIGIAVVVLDVYRHRQERHHV